MSEHIKTDLAECLRIEAALTTDPGTRNRLQAYIAEAEKLMSRTPQPVTPAGGEVGTLVRRWRDEAELLRRQADAAHEIGKYSASSEYACKASAKIECADDLDAALNQRGGG